MPRPKSGYFNAAGEPVPGTHDPISRYMDHTALMRWAHKQGQAGLPLYQRAAIDIGSAVHGMAELDLKGRPDREIEAYCHECLAAPDHLRKAFAAFQAFRAWRQHCQVRAIAQERALAVRRHARHHRDNRRRPRPPRLQDLGQAVPRKPRRAGGARGAVGGEQPAAPAHCRLSPDLPAEGRQRLCPPRLCGPCAAVGAVPAMARSVPA
jgi:hypothetical protein